MKCERLYSRTKTYTDDEDYWYYRADVLSIPGFPSVYLELHESYDETTKIRREGYTLIKAGDIPEESRTKGPDDFKIDIKHESGEVEIKPEELSGFCRESWVGGTNVLGVNSCLDLWGHPELMEQNQRKSK